MKLQLLTGATATNSPPVIATGSVTVVAKASLSDGEYFTIKTPAWPAGLAIEFDVSGDGVTAGRIAADVSGDTSADDVADTVMNAINNSVLGLELVATDGGTGIVSLKSKLIGAGPNMTITENVSDGSFAVSGMTSGNGGVYLWRKSIGGQGLERGTDKGLLTLVSSAGSGTMSTTIRLWGWNSSANDWLPMGVGTDSTKGQIDASTSLDETQADRIQHTEVIAGLSNLEAIYGEITAISGTGTAINLALNELGGSQGLG